MLVEIEVSLVQIGAPVHEFGTPSLSLDEALWTYLSPQIVELKAATREEIDLYGIANFHDKNLEILEKYLEHGRDRLQREEVSLIVIDLGEECGPDGYKRLLYDLDVPQSGETLSQIVEMIARARAERLAVRFRGQ